MLIAHNYKKRTKHGIFYETTQAKRCFNDGWRIVWL